MLKNLGKAIWSVSEGISSKFFSDSRIRVDCLHDPIGIIHSLQPHTPVGPPSTQPWEKKIKSKLTKQRATVVDGAPSFISARNFVDWSKKLGKIQQLAYPCCKRKYEGKYKWMKKKPSCFQFDFWGWLFSFFSEIKPMFFLVFSRCLKKSPLSYDI